MNEGVIRVIPCLDMMDGRIVKGVAFEGMRDAGDPAEAVTRYCDEGADEIGFLDIRASIEGRATNVSMIKNAVSASRVPILIGGGIASLETIELLLNAGASKVGIGSAAFSDKTFINKAACAFGSERVTALVDVRPSATGFECTVGGAQRGTGVELADWARYLEGEGAGEILLTSMRDGTREGYDIEAIRACSGAVGIPVVASGGAGKLEDFYKAVVEGGASAVLAASVFHFGIIKISEVKAYLRERGLGVMEK